MWLGCGHFCALTNKGYLGRLHLARDGSTWTSPSTLGVFLQPPLCATQLPARHFSNSQSVCATRCLSSGFRGAFPKTKSRAAQPMLLLSTTRLQNAGVQPRKVFEKLQSRPRRSAEGLRRARPRTSRLLKLPLLRPRRPRSARDVLQRHRL